MIITTTSRGNNWKKARESIRNMRNVEFPKNKENTSDAKLYPGRQPSGNKKAVSSNKCETANKSKERKTIAELEEDELIRKAKEEIRTAILSSMPDASVTSIEKANYELGEAIRRCGRP